MLSAQAGGEGVTRISVLVSDYGDPKLPRLILSLQAQRLPPGVSMEILVEPRGTIAESRNLLVARAQGSVMAFADTDRVFPSDWLLRLTAPIRAGYCDFTAGPGYPMENLSPKWLRYHERWMRRFYEVCRNDPTRFAMGNSAWSADVLHALPFDERLTKGGLGGDDYDINLRAVMAGFRGGWVEGAWCYDDCSEQASFFRVFRKRVKYSYGAGFVLHKNKPWLSPETRDLFRGTYSYKPSHATELLRPVLQGWAWVASWVGWQIHKNESPRSGRFQ